MPRKPNAPSAGPKIWVPLARAPLLCDRDARTIRRWMAAGIIRRTVINGSIYVEIDDPARVPGAPRAPLLRDAQVREAAPVPAAAAGTPAPVDPRIDQLLKAFTVLEDEHRALKVAHERLKSRHTSLLAERNQAQDDALEAWDAYDQLKAESQQRQQDAETRLAQARKALDDLTRHAERQAEQIERQAAIIGQQAADIIWLEQQLADAQQGALSKLFGRRKHG